MVSSLLCSLLGCVLVLLFALHFLLMGSHPCFFIYRVFLLSFFFNFLKRNAGGEAITVEQLLSMRDKLLSNSKTLNEPSRQIKYSFKAIHLNFILQSDGYTG